MTVGQQPTFALAPPRNGHGVEYAASARRRAALEEIDRHPYAWFHVKTVLVAGVGFFTDAYDVFAISIAATVLGLVYADATTLGTNADLGIKVATPVGTLLRMLFFGWLGDKLGRKTMYGFELIIMVIGTFGQALSSQGPTDAVTITGVIVVWRFILGLGVGGDEPLSATLTSEFAATRIRGRMMTTVFSMQGFGTFVAALVSATLVSAYKSYILSSGAEAVDRTWRLLIGLGCVPAVIALWFRLTIPETPRFTADVERDVERATREIDQLRFNQRYRPDRNAIVRPVQAPLATRSDFFTYFGRPHNLKLLLGMAWSWFALDFAVYSLGLNSTVVLGAIGFGDQTNDAANCQETLTNACMYQILFNASIGNIILSLSGLIPGFGFSFLLIDCWGRKPIQLMGFAVLTVIFVCMGSAYWKTALSTNQAAKSAFVFLYCLTNFFQNFDPNTTTFIIPGGAFPTRYRSTAHGLCAAFGKLGAIIAQVVFSSLKDWGGKNNWIGHILQIIALFMLTGLFSTLLLDETKQETLENLSHEEEFSYSWTQDDLNLPQPVALHGQPEAQLPPPANGHGHPANGHAHPPFPPFPPYHNHQEDQAPPEPGQPASPTTGVEVHRTTGHARLR
ncbi:MFS general substrate transporter [Dacryopinax primogenitus]|uniref:MFS general substrate transporter n=1 Tax=Dacryopinax primogenitus (strain DJM 731) TaxID=1858805 RepID=M5FRL8_DACPD|nr:MFS general substrate transporter [Dacryopinax primogenitus]EJT98358.1 MFS general substrate transporter [Dacryopinax primogenitus]